jgi:hypothetical protein
VDADRFLAELPRLFADYPRSEHPLDRRFAPIAEEVENLARENNLALLNLAARFLGPGEAYVEVGVFHGASLIAAMLGNEGKRFVGIDSFEFRDASLEKVEENLARYELELPEIVVGDAFELVAGARSGRRDRRLVLRRRSLVRAQFHGLRIAEPHPCPVPSSSPTTPTGTTSGGRWTTTSPPSHVPIAL